LYAVHDMNIDFLTAATGQLRGDGMGALQTDLTRRDSDEDEIVLGVLDVVERDPTVTQRSVARELGIALGLANAYLKRCIRKGLIKVGQVPRRRYAYFLTPQGFAEKSRLTATYLADSFSLFRMARTQCGDVFAAAGARGQKRLALLGPGDLAEIAHLVARDHGIDIVGIIDWTGAADRLAADIAALGPVDALVVTALARSSEIYSAARAAFGDDQVYAPALLRLHAGQPQNDVEVAQ
jgi:DNA-binding MarR family transcriptional regulator